MEERARRIVACAVVERAGEHEDLLGAGLVDIAARPRGAGVHLQHVGVRAGRPVPQGTQPDAREELADRGVANGDGGVAVLLEDLRMHAVHRALLHYRGPSVRKDIHGYDLAMHRVVAVVRSVQSTFELGFAAEVFGTAWDGVPRHY